MLLQGALAIAHGVRFEEEFFEIVFLYRAGRVLAWARAYVDVEDVTQNEPVITTILKERREEKQREGTD
jgi:hypothetical protein